MNIGIIGAGNVGGTLGKLLAQHGHAVKYGARNPESDKVKAALAATQSASAVSVAESIAFGEVVIIASNYEHALQVAQSITDWENKILVDATNRVDGQHHERAFAQELADAAHNARVVKAFNNQGFNIFENPMFDDQSATMLLAGDDDDAKATVTTLASALGFNVVDCGDLAIAYHLEKVAELWIHLAYRRGFGREIAFKLLQR